MREREREFRERLTIIKRSASERRHERGENDTYIHADIPIYTYIHTRVQINSIKI